MSISTKINSTVVAVFILLCLAVGTVIYVNWSANIRSMVAKNQLETARQLMATVDQYVYERYSDVVHISSERQVVDWMMSGYQKDRDTLQKELDEYTRTTGPWSMFRVVRSDGTVMASLIDGEIQTPLSDAIAVPFFQRALEGKPVYSDALETQTKETTLLFAVPIFSRDASMNQQVVGVVLAHMRWDAIADILNAVAENDVYIMTSGGFEIVSNTHATGEMNVFSDDKATKQFALAKSGKEGSYDMLGIRSLSPSLVTFVTERGYKTYAGNGWSLFFETPMSQILASIWSSMIPAGLLFLIVTTGGAVMLYVLLRHFIVSPIRHLTRVVRAMTSGDLSQQVDIVSDDEIGVLGGAFNDMTKKLSVSRTELETKVVTRTKELTQKAKELEAMNALMIGREVKMVALKREIAELKKRQS